MPENANFAIRAEIAQQFAASNGVAIHETRKEPRSVDWKRVANDARAISTLLYCDENIGEVPDLHPPTHAIRITATQRKGWPWIMIAILIGLGAALFAFWSNRGF